MRISVNWISMCLTCFSFIDAVLCPLPSGRPWGPCGRGSPGFGVGTRSAALPISHNSISDAQRGSNSHSQNDL